MQSSDYFNYSLVFGFCDRLALVFHLEQIGRIARDVEQTGTAATPVIDTASPGVGTRASFSGPADGLAHAKLKKPSLRGRIGRIGERKQTRQGKR